MRADLPPASLAFSLAALGLALSLGACASMPAPQPLQPVLPSSAPHLEMAPPSARDALAAALRRLAEEAPRTRVVTLPPPEEPGR